MAVTEPGYNELSDVKRQLFLLLIAGEQKSRKFDGICLRIPFNMNCQWSHHNQTALDYINDSVSFVVCSLVALNIFDNIQILIFEGPQL